MTHYHEAGKGSKPREGQDKQKYDEGWDRIFGKKEKSNQQQEKDDGKPTQKD